MDSNLLTLGGLNGLVLKDRRNIWLVVEAPAGAVCELCGEAVRKKENANHLQFVLRKGKILGYLVEIG